ncbi:hypothetical protein GE278_20475 [Enterobacteriaceae bacterium Kacie_13]|nr:hypothetical protein GE278_20475 [Enterobacteriaceae bacterium Kacie_13]
MDIRAQLMRIAAASEQATSTPSGCKACQRTGIPVFPLRVAAVPKAMVRTDWQPSVPEQAAPLSGKVFKYALRTLRMGYLYVLLDKSVWQAYEVTATGCMRQFNPYEMPEGETVSPLSEACRTAGHDVITSFINLDDKRYREAWLAFSSDPWTEEVLEEYKNALRPDSRFTKISISALKNSPHSIPDALPLDPDLSSLKANVAEFATTFFPDTARLGEKIEGSVHGFYPRMNKDKQSLMGKHISAMRQQYQCNIVALALHDSVGVVQELNNSAMQILEACQEYLEQPGVFHKHMISEAISQYIDNIRTAVVNNPVYTSGGPGIGGGYPQKVSPEVTLAQRTQRLRENYNEPDRAAFAREFEQRFSTPRERLAAIDKDLAAWYQALGWLNTIRHDYAPEACGLSGVLSWAAQMRTLGACVQGGILGDATKSVWAQWLKTVNSPAYLGFTGIDTSQLEAIFNFGNYKTILTSDEFGQALKSAAIQRSWAVRILAVSGAVSLLGKALEEAPRKGFMWMMQAAMLTAGESVVVLKYQTTFRALQKHLRHSAALRQAMMRNGHALSASGGNVSVIDDIMKMRGKGIDIPLEVEFSVPGTLAKLKNALPGSVDIPLNNPGVLDTLNDVYLSDLSLAEKGSNGPVVRASYAQIAKYGEQSRRLISGDGVGLVMGAALMGMQIALWGKLAERLHNSVGTDVVADMSINTLLLVEGFSELSGFAYKLATKKNWVVLSAAEQVPVPVRFGAVLGGIAGIIDGIRQLSHILDDYNSGDTGAAGADLMAGSFMIAGGAISVIWGAKGVFALTSTAGTGFLGLGPAGWAAILLITGAMLAYEASELRSTAFEIWLRRTCFGIDHKRQLKDIVWHANSMTDLAAAMVDYRAIVSGMVADVAFASAFSPTGRATIDGVTYERVDLQVSLPGWVADGGGWAVSLHRAGDEKVLFSQSAGAPGLDDHYEAVGPSGYYTYSLTVDGEEVEDGGKTKTVNSLNLMVSVWAEQSRTAEVILEANYWPDNTDANYQMGLTVNKQG